MLALLLFIGLWGSSYAVEGWKEFCAIDGECRVLFPMQPQHVREKMFLPPVNTWMEYDIYVSILQPKAIFLMLIAKYPIKVPVEKVQECLENFLKGMTSNNPDNHLIFADVNEIRGKMTLEFFLRSTSAFLRGKIFMEGGKLYLLAVESRSEAEIEGLFYPFVESFQLRKK